MDLMQKTQKKVGSTKKKLAKTIELKSYRKLAVNFLILSINLIIIILYFTLSQAKIVIVTSQDAVSYTASIDIVETLDENSELAVLGSITNVDVEHEKEFPIKANTNIEQNARGKITIYNTTTNRNQTLVENTRLQNEEGIEIKTSKRVQIPPNGQISIEAYATEPGVTGEVTTNENKFQIVALPHLKDTIYAKVSQNFTGGVTLVPTLTETIYKQSQTELEKILAKIALDLLKEVTSQEANPGDVTLNVLELNSTSNINDSNVDSFTMTAKAKASLFTYDEQNALEITKQGLIKKIPPDKLLSSFEENSYIAELVDENTIKTTIRASIIPKIPQTVLNQKEIVGMNEKEVRLHFIKISGIRDVQVKFWPFWVKSVPKLSDHVDIEIKK